MYRYIWNTYIQTWFFGLLTIICVVSACASTQSSTLTDVAKNTVNQTTNVTTARDANTVVYPSWHDLAGKTVLLVTHPQPDVLNAMRTLIKKHLLDADNLYVLGLYHQSESKDYTTSEQWIRNQQQGTLPGTRRDGPPPIGLRKLDCAITPDSVFNKNGCTQEYQDLLAHSAAIIFTGGPDIPPKLYGETTRLTTVVTDPVRHYWEISFLSHLLGSLGDASQKPLLSTRPNYPILAICLGMQSLNVATGGTLIQDIPSEVYQHTNYETVRDQPSRDLHRNPHYFLSPEKGLSSFVMHPIKLSEDRMWQAELNWKQPGLESGKESNQILVSSGHHQAVEKLGKNIRTIATSPDGKIIEAVAHKQYAHVLGIQFHPEYDFVWEPAIEARTAPSCMDHSNSTQSNTSPVETTCPAKANQAAGGKNDFVNTLQNSPQSMTFNKQIWITFSQWINAEAKALTN